MFRELSNSEIKMVAGGAGTATFTGSSWRYGNACYATAQDAKNAGATGFRVGDQYFGKSGNPFDSPCMLDEGCSVPFVSYERG